MLVGCTVYANEAQEPDDDPDVDPDEEWKDEDGDKHVIFDEDGHEFEYIYDPDGNLLEVIKDGVVIEDLRALNKTGTPLAILTILTVFGLAVYRKYYGGMKSSL
jgi:hypothetical protein